MSVMRLTTVFCALLLTGCAHMESDSRVKTDADDAAYKAGKIAHTAAEKTEKAAKVAGEKIKEAAKSAEQGWKDNKPK
jgi:hypothetical protein